ncbi:MAG TPA: helix-turn-helix domain-containing protein [Solirubrobacterales bacterium]|nr:helix-turn-helix domain-containing protein [Solirubrobacterales bacterium]
MQAKARIHICERLRARRPEIEKAILARVYALPNPAGTEHPDDVQGLREAVSTAFGYGLAAVERGDARGVSIPTLLYAQIRDAARNNVSLDTVLRRYFTAYILLGDFFMQEAGNGVLPATELQRVQRAQAELFDRLLSAISEEYARETEGDPQTREQRRFQLVERLLAGELVDTAQLGYDIAAWHIGAIAVGPGVEQAFRKLATIVDCRILLVGTEEDGLWVWLGARRRIATVEVARSASTVLPDDVYLTLGEPGEGLAGWCLTHRQARAAWPIARRGTQSLVRYADVALLASVLQDSVLTTSLYQLYLVPLMRERDGGESARRTLRAFLATDRNISSAAAALGLNRHTVANRLRMIEMRLGRSLSSCAGPLDVALRLEGLGYPGSSPNT